jgi:hypothetical protein
VDDVPDALDDERNAPGREQRERRNLLRGRAPGALIRWSDVAAGVLQIPAKPVSGDDRASLRVAHAGRHDQRVPRVLVERSIRKETQLLRFLIPHDPVDAHDAVP